MTYAQDLASRFKVVALRNGLCLTDEELDHIVFSVLYGDSFATHLTQYEFQLKAILQDLGLFEKQKFGPYRLFYKGGNTWSIRNEQNKEILAGSKERMLKALEAHLGEVESRRQAVEAESRAAFDNLIIPCPGKDAWI
jgi:hypothetical protein